MYNFSKPQMPMSFKVIISVIVIVIVTIIYLNYQDQNTIATVNSCKVMELQQQQLITGTGTIMKTEIRYLVITDKETFICTNSLYNGKFNNSDIFWRLKKNSTYTFTVAGKGKSALYDYRNILEYKLQ